MSDSVINGLVASSEVEEFLVWVQEEYENPPLVEACREIIAVELSRGNRLPDEEVLSRARSRFHQPALRRTHEMACSAMDSNVEFSQRPARNSQRLAAGTLGIDDSP